MKVLIILFSLILIGCNGEKERSSAYTSKFTDRIVGEISEDFVPEFDNVRKSELFVDIKPEIEPEIDKSLSDHGFAQDIIGRNVGYTQNMEPVNDINLDDGFRLVGHYGEDGCLWKIYKKEYEVSWLYIHVDCEGNRLKLQRGK
ncbi:hypothetical protein KAR91_60595 [Candidatus Pacearchaeota archaeon]|nr:hypothetical protein [Candidatus Pacearchaeota archaeon]